MTKTTKPLHVQVAEVLGWERTADCGIYGKDREKCYGTGTGGCVKRYDTDWIATGPLIEKIGISLFQHFDTKQWSASQWGPDGDRGFNLGWHSTPLTAVCKLILKMRNDGRL